MMKAMRQMKELYAEGLFEGFDAAGGSRASDLVFPRCRRDGTFFDNVYEEQNMSGILLHVHFP